MTPARAAAYRVLRAVFGGDDLPHALARIRDTLGDERDRALVTEITTGTLRWLGSLDRVIEQVADRPIDRLDAEVLTVLRLGAYQLLHLERVPHAAAVHESVTLVRRVGKASAAGLVNAVLRGIATTARTPPLPPEPCCDRHEAGSARLPQRDLLPPPVARRALVGPVRLSAHPGMGALQQHAPRADAESESAAYHP